MPAHACGEERCSFCSGRASASSPARPANDAVPNGEQEKGGATSLELAIGHPPGSRAGPTGQGGTPPGCQHRRWHGFATPGTPTWSRSPRFEPDNAFRLSESETGRSYRGEEEKRPLPQGRWSCTIRLAGGSGRRRGSRFTLSRSRRRKKTWCAYGGDTTGSMRDAGHQVHYGAVAAYAGGQARDSPGCRVHHSAIVC